MENKEKYFEMQSILCDRSINDRELLSYIKGLSYKERNYFVFRLFYDGNNEELMHKVEDVIWNHLFIKGQSVFSLYKMVEKGNGFNKFREHALLNREIYSDIMYYYNNLLNKMVKLSNELGLSSSFELCLFFTYLLWNGYLSKDKKYIFSSINRKDINGLFFVDIIDGIGVCLNDSIMLTDFLNYYGYNSSNIVNYNNPRNIAYRKIFGIKRTFDKNDNNDSFSPKFYKKEANHVYNLIDENGKVYVYDSANLLFHNVICSKCTSIINGEGKNEIFLYSSLRLAYSNKEVELIDRLFMNNCSPMVYSIDHIENASRTCMDIINTNKALIDYFYDEVKPFIDFISMESDKVFKYKSKVISK